MQLWRPSRSHKGSQHSREKGIKRSPKLQQRDALAAVSRRLIRKYNTLLYAAKEGAFDPLPVESKRSTQSYTLMEYTAIYTLVNTFIYTLVIYIFICTQSRWCRSNEEVHSYIRWLIYLYIRWTYCAMLLMVQDIYRLIYMCCSWFMLYAGHIVLFMIYTLCC